MTATKNEKTQVLTPDEVLDRHDWLTCVMGFEYVLAAKAYRRRDIVHGIQRVVEIHVSTVLSDPSERRFRDAVQRRVEARR